MLKTPTVGAFREERAERARDRLGSHEEYRVLPWTGDSSRTRRRREVPGKDNGAGRR